MPPEAGSETFASVQPGQTRTNSNPGSRERFHFWTTHLSLSNTAGLHYSLTVHRLVFLFTISLYFDMRTGQHLGLYFCNSNASSNTLNPKGNTVPSGGKGLAEDQGPLQILTEACGQRI